MNWVNNGNNPFFFPFSRDNEKLYSKGMPVRGHLDRSLTSRHHASSGTDSPLPKTNAYKPTAIKRLSIIMGPVLSWTAQIVWCSEPTRTPIHTLWKWDMPTSFHSLTRSMSWLSELCTGNSHVNAHISMREKGPGTNALFQSDLGSQGATCFSFCFHLLSLLFSFLLSKKKMVSSI